ncbi:MAG: molecular chaperone DnaK, partial [Actinomycetota bacterium]|nr:molecular chaperone DnaK [Actinomycetota bacterium]
MAYQLGVDLGTTYTAAAVARADRVEIASLGDRAAAVPSALFMAEDGRVLVGDSATRRRLSDPSRVVREFKRRLGDPTPVLVAGTPYSAEALMARLLRWVIDQVTEREGSPPELVAVTYPANWGPYKQELLAQALRLADVERSTVLTEPEAAAISYAENERIEPGEVVAVYDLGGGTFDAAVLRKTANGFEILGKPEGVERLGGIDFDEAVFAHVAGSLDGAVESLDPEDEGAVTALARLREECVQAKEALSADTDTSVPVLLPNRQTEVRLTRSEFETMVRPALEPTVGALRRALRSAGVEAGDVKAVLLVGGSSRIPLVGQMVAAELGRPVAVDAHPKHAIALGAALAAAEAARVAAAAAGDDGAAPSGSGNGAAPEGAAPPEAAAPP